MYTGFMAKNANPGTGKLKIGDDWNAITIIALSQNNPLKAIAEFVENSIDAGAKNISIIRGKEKGEIYLRIVDDGEGIKDLKYVATHIGDSIKRKLKKAGAKGIQGEFGIGLLSFWTVGKELALTTAPGGENPSRMKLVSGNPGYSISPVNHLFTINGTEALIKPVLPGVRSLSGERLQAYLASELRDRIIRNSVSIRIYDKLSRKQLDVEPRKFHGRLLHDLPELRSPFGDIYCELYLNEPSPDNELGLYKLGTRIIPAISKLDAFNEHPWNSPYLEGIIDCSFLQLTPGTRDGVILDDKFSNFCDSLSPLSEFLKLRIEEQKLAEEEKASSAILTRIAKAFREAFVYLADLDYSWLDMKKRGGSCPGQSGKNVNAPIDDETGVAINALGEEHEESPQKEFFEYPGPLYKTAIVPAKTIIAVNSLKKFKAVCKDKKGKEIDHGLIVEWEVSAGHGNLKTEGPFCEFTAGPEPEGASLKVTASDGKTQCSAEAVITVTAELIDKKEQSGNAGKGLPGYTYLKAPGELWRSKYDPERNLITINNGHSDFVYASKLRNRQLKYIAKLFAKEMVLFNFPGAGPEESLERMSELLLYIEENL